MPDINELVPSWRQGREALAEQLTAIKSDEGFAREELSIVDRNALIIDLECFIFRYDGLLLRYAPRRPARAPHYVEAD